MRLHFGLDEARERLHRFFRREGRLPSYGEMCLLFGYSSKNAAFRLTQKLIDADIVEKSPAGKLVPKNLSVPVKVLGSIQAGFPSQAEEELLDTLSLDDYLIDKPEVTYLLRVTGDSMIEAGIKPGDLVIVDRSRQAKHGDIVVACVDGEWTLKYLEKTGGQLRLVPANKNFEPIIPESELSIAGVVNGVVRKYF